MAGIVILGGGFQLFIALLPSSLTNTDVSARQGETFEVEGGKLTPFGWCASVECPDGGDGNVWVWAKVCATEDGWDIDEADFWLSGRSTGVAPIPTPSPAALGQRMLDAGDCWEGISAFGLREQPTDFFYEGHGFDVDWVLNLGAQIPRTEAILERLRAGERRWLLEFERFYRRVLGLLPEQPGFTVQELHSLAALGEDCPRILERDPGRFRPVTKTVEKACGCLRVAARHFVRAAANFDDPDDKALDKGLQAALPGRDALIRAHHRALLRMWSLR